MTQEAKIQTPELVSSAPEISVIIPTYNRADSMLETLQSCWTQSYSDFEVILVDDGSSDNTREVAEAVNDARLRYVHQNNAGPARARNHGMELARGNYLAFLDSDDIWYPDHLANALDAIKQQGAGFVYTQIIIDRGVGRYWVKPSRGIEAGENVFDYLYVHGGFIQTSTIVVNADLTRSTGWDEALTYGDNDQFAIDLCKAGAVPLMLENSQTLYADFMSPNALSQLPVFSGNSEKHTNFLRWMENQAPHMSAAAQTAFAARYQSVSLARTAPLDCIKLIVRAWRAGAMSASGVVRQLLQSFTPRLYRKVVDQFVRFRGATLAEVTRQ